MKDALIYRYNDKPLGVDLILCLFSIIKIGSQLRSTSPLEAGQTYTEQKEEVRATNHGLLSMILLNDFSKHSARIFK